MANREIAEFMAILGTLLWIGLVIRIIIQVINDKN